MDKSKGVNHAEVSTLCAYQKVLSKWVFETPNGFAEEFAQKRFHKKLEVPSNENRKALHANAWHDFISFDQTLPDIHLPSGEWYKARALLHSWVRGDRTRCPVDFPKGSSVIPTRGFNSVEFRLAGGPWTCTPENLDEFSRLVYNHKALKRAFRRRYTNWFLKQRFSITFKESEKILWSTFRDRKKPAWEIFQWKMSRIVSLVRGSRFSTVPKNNQKRRPINIEPFGNILVQRQIGNFLRKCLNDQGLNLDTLAEIHRERISDPSYATIDLKNASDSVSIRLVEFMFPKGLVRDFDRSRSPLLFGDDKEYHVLKKISSMGNGFTFELMTMILNALCRSLDPTASVFGDDIVIKKDCASRLIELLKEVGFEVNLDKSFLDGPFRESCGANYHDDYGYIKSFDFLYPQNIGECALILTKCYALRESYDSFRRLYDQLLRRTPHALLGGPLQVSGLTSWQQPDLIVGFACDKDYLPKCDDRKARHIKETLQYKEVLQAYEYRWKPELRTKTLVSLNPKYHWAKYEMYLGAGRITKDVVSQAGRWVKVKVYFTDGIYRE